MFIGHYGIGLALKKVEPRLSLGLLIFGAIMLDILFGLFLISGLEHAKIVHGATVVSPFEFYDYPLSHSAAGAAMWAIAGFLVYWLWPGGDRMQRKRSAFILAYLYRSATCSVSSSGKYGFALMILILLVLYIGNIFGPPPLDIISVAVTMTAGQLALVALAFWVDKNRVTKGQV